MSFIVVAPDGETIVIDGGQYDDAQYLYSFIKDRPVSAWIITHTHPDHVCAVNKLLEDSAIKLNIDSFIFNFPSTEFVYEHEPLYAPFQEEFLRLVKERGIKTISPESGDIINIGKLSVNVIMTTGPDCLSTVLNNHSLVFRIDSPHHRALFLGDLEPDGGDRLLEKTRLCPQSLKADIVQAAHHGHMSVERKVYEIIRPEAAMWCDPPWLYDEALGEIRPGSRMFGTKTTRRWLDELGVKRNYVSGEGTQEIPFD